LPMASSAAFIGPRAVALSSLEVGRVAQITAGGGTEFGWAYTYALIAGTDPVPAGLTIDSETGVLTVTAPLAAGVYHINVHVQNRRGAANPIDFPITVQVYVAVTANRTGNQILHKTYDPHSGLYGTPTGNNWTAVLNAINAQILADQVTNGDD